jgi:ComF family protein
MGIFKQFIDIIYPPKCLICQKFLYKDGLNRDFEDPLICPSCFDGFIVITPPYCSVCGRPFESSIEDVHTCEGCLLKTPDYTKIMVPYLYDGSLMTAIHQFKYGGKSHMSPALAFLLMPFAERLLEEIDNGLIMPVPLHPKRLRERGFNQSLLLARHIAASLSIELDFLSLRRIKYTLPQAGLKKAERRKNVRRAFELRDTKVVKGRHIILVDDVTTTGNTLNECARVLRKAGCKEVYCLVLARTSGT